LENTRVVLGPMPELLRDILRSGLLAEPNAEIVGDTADDASVVNLCLERRADAVVLQADDALELQLETSVSTERAFRIVAVAPSGRSARMHRLSWHIDVLSEVSFQQLRDVILGGTKGVSAGVTANEGIPPQPIE
jgi:hypothetical protein